MVRREVVGVFGRSAGAADFGMKARVVPDVIEGLVNRMARRAGGEKDEASSRGKLLACMDVPG
jgi:hypothetical protein